MEDPDRLGDDGRWLEVPRLPQMNGTAISKKWCGRASAAMLHDFYKKAQGKASEYIAHEVGDPGKGPNGKVKENLRWIGGPLKGEIAAIDERGLCSLATVFRKAGWKIREAHVQKSAAEKVSTERAAVEERFAPIVEQLKKNNPILLYTRLSTSTEHGHIVVLSGYKHESGDLWLRVTDPAGMNLKRRLIGPANFEAACAVTLPFSEYWARASRLVGPHPDDERKTLLSYKDDALFGRYLYVTDQPVKDDSELVHIVGAATAPQPQQSSQTQKPKQAQKPQPKPPPMPPEVGGASMPWERNGSTALDAEALAALYHSSERGSGGFFPLGEWGACHCGAHFALQRGTMVRSIAAGDVVAARISAGAGKHPWGDTGFVLLRHLLKGNKPIYSLLLHLEREPLHPDRTRAAWLRSVLIAALQDPDAKSKWKVAEETPSWKEADKGTFSPVNVQLDQKLAPGTYDEEDRLVEDHGIFVKLNGMWIRAATPDGDGEAKELSPWADFDLDEAAKKSALVAALRDGKVAVLDGEKDSQGARKFTVGAGEVIGVAGEYLGQTQVHWSVFSKDAVFPTGSLPKEEYGATDEVKLQDLDVSSKDAGTIEHVKALAEALDPKKRTPLGKAPQDVLAPGELRHFYRTPAESWRSRYLAVKAIADFKLDAAKIGDLDRNRSHDEAERKDFKENARGFLFWDELSSVDLFPADGKGIFVHPATALRLMSGIALEADRDGKAIDGDGADEHVILALRDASGPLAATEVVVLCDGAEVLKGKSDSQGMLLLPLAAVAGKEIEIQVASVPNGAELVVAGNDTGAPRTLTAGEPHTWNGTDAVPEWRMGATYEVKDGQAPGAYAKWDARRFKESDKLRALKPGETVTVERIVFRKDDGKHEAIQTHVDGQVAYVWSIWDGQHNFDALLDEPGRASQQSQDPVLSASWSSKLAHLNDHPVFSARVKNVQDGAAAKVSFFALVDTGAEEHDQELSAHEVKVAQGGIAVPFDPHELAADHDLLSHPQPVFAKVEVSGKVFALRSALITVYSGPRLQNAPPPVQRAPAGAKTIVAFAEIARTSPIDGQLKTDRYRTSDGNEPALRKLSQLSSDLRRRFVAQGSDELYIGTVGGELHLATEEQQHMSAAEAIVAQRDALLRIYPDAPVKKLYSRPEDAYFSNWGMTVGICAQDCSHKLHARGVQSGCTEEIRQKNLLACANVAPRKKRDHDPTELCRTAVPEPTRLPIVAKRCFSDLGTCHSVHHDKSRCFLQTVVRGPESVERGRWYVSFPFVTDDWRARPHDHRRWPYHGDLSGAVEGKKVPPQRHFRVLLMNPQNGAAVVCSGEDWGRHRLEDEGNQKIDGAAVALDEFRKKGRVFGLNPVVRWKLNFHGSHGAPVVLFAFVPANTPLGPVPDDTVIQLRKQASYLQIMGVDPVPESAP